MASANGGKEDTLHMPHTENPQAKNWYFVTNEDGEIEGARTIEQAAARLGENYAGNIARAVHTYVHMEAAKIQDVGSIRIGDDTGITIYIPAPKT